MKYKVTKHYSKTKEQLIAVFSESEDASIFIEEKISQAEGTAKMVLFRLYDDFDFIRELANGMISTTDPEDPESFNPQDLLFNLAVQLENSLDRSIIANFSEQNDANLFVTAKYNKNASSTETFMIYKNKVLIATLNKTMVDKKALKETDSSGDRSNATLSPLSTRPTPPGGPGDFWVEKKEDEN